MDGFDTARALKADERTRATPLVGFTSLGFSGRKAEDAGCDVLLRKTSPPDLLATTVWKLLRPRPASTP
jgi:CheY-like chemotaxis protein